jgi:hypothetical protein
MRSGMRKQGLPDSESSRGQGRMRMTQRVGEVVLVQAVSRVLPVTTAGVTAV